MTWLYSPEAHKTMIELIRSTALAVGGTWLCLKMGWDWQMMCIIVLLWISVVG